MYEKPQSSVNLLPQHLFIRSFVNLLHKLQRLIRLVLLLIVPPIPFEVDWRWRVRLAECNGLAVGADGLRVVRVVLEELEMPQALVAMVDVNGHQAAFL